MPKRAAGLTAVEVRTAKPGIHVDGAGLMLVVKPSGAATWMLRYSMARRRRDTGLGAARGPNAVSLAEARAKAADLRKMILAGVDPLERRGAEAAEAEAARLVSEREAAARAMTFRRVADLYLHAHEKGWDDPKTFAAWEMTLRVYAHPIIGEIPVGQITTEHVEAVLRPIWVTKTETASRLRGRIESVLGFAAAKGLRPRGDNPALWRGHLDKLFPKRSRVAPVEHFPALPWTEIADFMRELRMRAAMAARALEFAILTASRTGAVRLATWREMNLQNGVWTAPAKHMKAKQEHRVPLSDAALAVLCEVRPLAESEDALVFPGARPHRPLSDMALLILLRRMNGRGKGQPRWRDAVTGEPIVPHGFRSTFRDWAGEATAHPREVVEAALAHRLGSKAELAYARGDLFAKRRRLMDEWSEFCGPVRSVIWDRELAADVAGR